MIPEGASAIGASAADVLCRFADADMRASVETALRQACPAP